MASPPFDINQAIPGDNDIVSQHPLNARAFRDIVESWFLVDGNNSGGKEKISFHVQTETPSQTPDADTIQIYFDTLGYSYLRHGPDAAIELFGVPPGAVFWTASGGAPAGYLIANGQEVSRTTYARLFAIFGTTYGAGNGTTTYNVPDLTGQVPVGIDPTQRVLSGVGAQTIGAHIGEQNHTLNEFEIPSHTHGGTTNGASTRHHHPGVPVYDPFALASTNGNTGLFIDNILRGSSTTNSGDDTPDHNHAFTTDATGGGLAHNNVQPGIILTPIIKY